MKVNCDNLKSETIEGKLLFAALVKIMVEEKKEMQDVVDSLSEDYFDITARIYMRHIIKEFKNKTI